MACCFLLSLLKPGRYVDGSERRDDINLDSQKHRHLPAYVFCRALTSSTFQTVTLPEVCFGRRFPAYPIRRPVTVAPHFRTPRHRKQVAQTSGAVMTMHVG
jgi:hypothetical protein